MEKYQHFIHSLLDTHTQHATKNTYTISAYIPNPGSPIRDLQHQARVMVLDQTHQHPAVGDKNQLCQILAERAEEVVGTITDASRGIALFMSFDVTKAYKTSDQIHAEIVVLNTTPTAEISVGRMYDFDQLLWISSLHAPTLVAAIERNDWTLFHLMDNGSLKKIETKHNPYIEAERPNDQFHHVAPDPGSSIPHGTGSYSIKHRFEKENEQFLMDLFRYLDEHQEQLPNFSYFILAHSSSYSEFIDTFTKDFGRLWPKVYQIFLPKQFNKLNELALEASQQIQDHLESSIKKEWQLAKEAYSTFVDDWPTVVAAAHDGKIEVLFVPSSVSKPGYVLNQELPYTESVDGALEVRNVVPWMVKRVAETDGRIIVSDKIDEEDAPLAAKLRY